MTGYKPIYEPWLQLGTDDAMYAKSVPLAWAVIKDGPRVGLVDDIPVAYNVPNDRCSGCNSFDVELYQAFNRCESTSFFSARGYMFEH